MNSMLRQASRSICDLILFVLPGRKKMWALAIRAEADSIAKDSAAFWFALDALRGVALTSLAQKLMFGCAFLSRSFSGASSGVTHRIDKVFGDSRTGHVGFACAIGAVCLGLAYLYAADAPTHMLAINTGALIVGLTAVAIWTRLPVLPSHRSGTAALAMSLALVATGLSGSAVDGVSRWITLGSLAIQPSLILLPLIILTFARDRGTTATASVLIAALAVAIQPDRAMAGALMCSVTALTIARRDRSDLVALAASVAAFVATMISSDRLQAAAYVDQVLYSAFEVHIFAGVTGVAGAALLLIPALHGIRSGSPDRTLCVTFGAVWLSVIMAAALGNYPTPVVGYGGSAILGYLFSLVALLPSEGAQISARPSKHSRNQVQAQDFRASFVSYQPS